jgi:hypothetical protein
LFFFNDLIKFFKSPKSALVVVITRILAIFSL